MCACAEVRRGFFCLCLKRNQQRFYDMFQRFLISFFDLFTVVIKEFVLSFKKQSVKQVKI